MSVLNFYLEKFILYDIEIFLKDDSVYGEMLNPTNKNFTEVHDGDNREARIYGFFQMFEATPFQESRIVKAKNMF